jgi:hypothetical protein
LPEIPSGLAAGGAFGAEIFGDFGAETFRTGAAAFRAFGAATFRAFFRKLTFAFTFRDDARAVFFAFAADFLRAFLAITASSLGQNHVAA